MVPAQPKLYHIVHVENLASIISDGELLSDSVMSQRPGATVIGMQRIKARRLTLPIECRPGLCVGECVPFYFCPRSIMLYLIYCRSDELEYKGGQGPIVHLEFDLGEIVAWAEGQANRWAFSLSNAGARYFEARCDLAQLHEINWEAVHSNRWAGNGISRSVKEGKQAEFLVERVVPWRLVNRIGVYNTEIAQRVAGAMQGANHRPVVQITRNWYY